MKPDSQCLMTNVNIENGEFERMKRSEANMRPAIGLTLTLFKVVFQL